MTCQQTQFKSRGIFWYRNTTRPSPSVSHICQSITHFRLDNMKILTLKIILSRFSGNDPVIIWYELPQICLECDIRQMHLESKKKGGILIFFRQFRILNCQFCSKHFQQHPSAVIRYSNDSLLFILFISIS